MYRQLPRVGEADLPSLTCSTCALRPCYLGLGLGLRQYAQKSKCGVTEVQCSPMYAFSVLHQAHRLRFSLSTEPPVQRISYGVSLVATYDHDGCLTLRAFGPKPPISAHYIYIHECINLASLPSPLHTQAAMHALEAILALTSRLASVFISGTEQSAGNVVFYNPTLGGGSMLVNTLNGYGEPLNVIISGESSQDILTDDGVVNYARAIGFSEECFGIHLGTPFPANLGDGNGWVNQTIELRQDYGDSGVGTCLESLIGGNHFRMFRQNGTTADSGGLFLAVSKEEPATDNHDIIPDGYNIGRDSLVASAIGETDFNGVRYITKASNISGLLAPGDQGINHGVYCLTLAMKAWTNLFLGGGAMLEDTSNGYGEPLNVIVSNESSPGVLTDDGFVNYARAIGFSEECFGIHLGAPFSANLGDGNGTLGQSDDRVAPGLRQSGHWELFGEFDWRESFPPESENHDIIPNGYNIGRDCLVAIAIGETIFHGVRFITHVARAQHFGRVSIMLLRKMGITLLTVTIV
ncbi:hypothetical protein JVT61DRAFT_842 [Boletus reticuloceps]|uniref:Uncharacterized protein n=1 Tax=Boletus reticuloceps TaxID=495285 RepID=A0A8I2Z411_9AGAM|nr:hypothetical protein JVT61DRAFT_842 [Boletus reticuloceps]